MTTSRSSFKIVPSHRRFPLPLADSDLGRCLLTCPVCFNSATSLRGLTWMKNGWTMSLSNECGHRWTLNFEQKGDELLVETRG
jgi:hypothetical protein